MSDAKMVKTVSVSEYHLWKKTTEKRTLLSVSLELTARCNNACTHCYINLPVDDTTAQKKELSFVEIKKIVDEAVSLGCLWFLLTGGEPLLRDDFFDIYTYIKKQGVQITLFTNASLISQEHIQLFKKYPPKNIEVSVYGITQKTHRKVTRRKFFKNTMEGINRLLGASLPITFKTTILKSNFKELSRITKFYQDKSDSIFRFDPFLHLRVDRNETRNRQILGERLTQEEIIALEQNNSVRLSALEKKCRDLQKPENIVIDQERIFKCNAGKNTCHINYEGIFKLCISLCNDQCTYDLRQGTLTEAWKLFSPSVMLLTSKKKAFKDKCGSCNISALCTCCPAHADLETGELDNHIQYFCDLAHGRFDAFKKTKLD